MARIFEAANVEDAVDLAQQMKRDGRYDLFRGQIHDWPAHSSLHRLNAGTDVESQARAYQRLAMFAKWTKAEPKLAHLIDEYSSGHEFFATMQHYGIPTHYIDFTTEPAVAGFFAGDATADPPEGFACIYCLNSIDLIECWETIKLVRLPTSCEIEIVRINVDNLWRLQAQHGVFLYANYNWDIDYPLDKILFPFGRHPSYPQKSQIYPEHKSPLEGLLDQYFDHENSVFTAELLHELVNSSRKSGSQNFAYVQWEIFKRGISEAAFLSPSNIHPLGSWSKSTLALWETYPIEDFFETVGSTLSTILKPAASISELKKHASFAVRQKLLAQPNLRDKAVEWNFGDLLNEGSREDLRNFIRATWNGMRSLPYTDAEIADAIALVLALHLAGFRSDQSPMQIEAALAEYFGPCTVVGFSYANRIGSRAYVSTLALTSLLRPDLGDLLKTEHGHRANDLVSVFGVVYNPSLLFEFEGFKQLFAYQIIPVQILMRRSPVLFNPAKIEVFGNP